MKTVNLHTAVGLKNEEYCLVVQGDDLAKEITELDVELEIQVNGQKVGRAQVTGAWGGSVAFAPAVLLEKHHDPVCRVYSGLLLLLSIVARKEVDGMATVSLILVKPLPDSKIELVPNLASVSRGKLNGGR